MSDPGVCATGPEPDRSRWWSRSLRWWHLAYAGLVALTAILFAVYGAPWPAYLLLAALAGWYALLGPRALAEPRPRLGIAYLIGAFALFGVMGYLSSGALVLLYALYPQSFAVLKRFRLALVFVAALSVLYALILVARTGWSVDTLLDSGLDGMISLAVAALLGGFIEAITRESDRRAALIAELESTRAQLADAYHRAGVLAERERLSHEIHDTLAQGFTSLLMLIQAADAAVLTDSGAARQRLALAEETARDNLAEARALVAALAPSDLQSATLPDAVRRLAARAAAELDLPAVVHVDGEPRPLAPNSQVVLLRSAQEALANVRKHAAATAVTVSLRYGDPGGDGSGDGAGDGAGATLEVTDDGRGFTVAAGNGDGFGLHGMRRRAEQMGGMLEVDSAVGRGTTIRVRVP